LRSTGGAVPKYSRAWRLTLSTSPAGVMKAIRAGIAVGDRAIMVLARTLHHFLRPSSVFNNDIQSAPFDDLSGCVD
jgi:hypothetical protein